MDCAAAAGFQQSIRHNRPSISLANHHSRHPTSGKPNSILPIINVYSALANSSSDFPDGEHPNSDGAQLIANTIYDAIKSQL